MKLLPVIVDFDNIEARHRSQGPLSLARMLMGLLPANLLYPYDLASFRLYGGWRTGTNLTNGAAILSASISQDSQTTVTIKHLGEEKKIRVSVSLAGGPAGSRKILPDTYVRNRKLRHFKALNTPWHECANHQSCGMSFLHLGHNGTPCRTKDCFVHLGDVLVRDEQKMVDTLMVADIAHETFVSKAEDIIVVSSDSDVWPGIFLALRNGRRITQIHSKTGFITPPSLTAMLDQAASAGYREFSI